MKFTWLALPLVLTAVSCSGSDEDRDSDDDDDDGNGSSHATPSPPLIGAAGVRITQVAIYQGVKRVLMLEGAPAQSTVPLVAGRDTFVRVFYALDAGYEGHEITGRLTLEGGAPIEGKQTLYGLSNDADPASTVNFWVPGDRVGSVFDWSVGLLTEGDASADNPGARYPAAGTEQVPVEGPLNTLRVILAPFAYHADGSGRLPDTSPEQVERFRQRFRAIYPVSNVEVSVRQPTEWNGAISPTGQGWQAVGLEVFGMRGQDNAPEDVYYYGIFDPASSFYKFCGQGCLLGVTLLNDQPSATGNVGLRLALGVGFPEVALDTAAHELGHAHGRPHADCGYGLDPQSIDQDYPYPEGSIGQWGYDITTGALYDPNVFTDIMGYCEQQHVSDYNYTNLFHRGVNVNMALMHPPTETVDYDLVEVDGQGGATFRAVRGPGRPITGVPTEVALLDGHGRQAAVTGRYVRFDHLPGGWLFVPRTPDVAATRAEFVVDGVLSVAHR